MLTVVFETSEELEYHNEKKHRRDRNMRGGKQVYNAGGLLGVRVEEDEDNSSDDNHRGGGRGFGRGRGGRGFARGGTDSRRTGGDKGKKVAILDNFGKDMEKIFKKGEFDHVELLPTYVKTGDGQVDLRYFLIASGNFSNVGREKVSEGDQYQKKATYVDDLEVPSKRSHTIEQLFKYIERYYGKNVNYQISESYRDYKSNRITAAILLEDFLRIFGNSQGFRYYWWFAVSSTYNTNEMHKALGEYASKLPFLNPSCVLAKHSKSYRSIFKSLVKRLGEYLNGVKDEIESFNEQKINTVISTLFNYEVGSLIQGRYLQHYISAKSLEVLMHIFFTAKENYEDMFDECHKVDLVTVFIYWSIIKTKTTDGMYSSPGFRGIDWIKEQEDTLDLGFLKISTPEEIKEKKQAKIDKKLADPDEFPTLTNFKSDANEKDLFKILQHGRNKEGYKKKPARQNRQPQAKKPEPKKEQITRVYEPKYRNDSSEERKPIVHEIQIQPGKKPKQEPEPPKPKYEAPKSPEDHFPKLGGSSPSGGNKLLPQPEKVTTSNSKSSAIPKKKINEEPPLLHKYLPEADSFDTRAQDQFVSVGGKRNETKPAENNKDEDDLEGDFPSLGGGANFSGPNLIEKLQYQSEQKKPNNKKKPQTKQGKKEVPLDQSASIFTGAAKWNSSNSTSKPEQSQVEKEPAVDDFPSLPAKPKEAPVAKKPVETQPMKTQTSAPKQPAQQAYNPKAVELDFKDAVDFDDRPAPKKEKNKKGKKKGNRGDDDDEGFTANDFPQMEVTAPPTGERFIDKYEGRIKELLTSNPLDHLTPAEREIYNNAAKKELKAPDIGKNYNDLGEMESEVKPSKKELRKQAEKKAQQAHTQPVDDDDDFPTLGGGGQTTQKQAGAKPVQEGFQPISSSLKGAELLKADLLAEQNGLQITKKNKKKK